MTQAPESSNSNTSATPAVARAAAGLKLYDTASHAVSAFTPLKAGNVGIYVCGATVQSSPHIGHIRAAVAFDVVRRWFLRLGYKVTFIRNVTDIDDKILDKAAAAGQQWWERAYFYEREFTQAYDTLGVLPPTYEPRATGHMMDMVALIQRIIDNGHGYVVKDQDGKPTGNVYFDVASWPHYGELTHQKQGADGAAPADPDVFSAYPTLSTTTVQDATVVFVAGLAEQGITVDGDAADGTVPEGLEPIASVSSATLSEILAFTLQHSDNTLAEEFGRLTAIARRQENSPQGGTAAVRAVLGDLGIDTAGLTMADCSGLSTGSKVSVRTMVAVQARNLTASGAAGAAEGLSVPGLVGTAANRAVSGGTLGLLRVKTGSLGEVTSMVGNVSRTEGGALAFAVIVNQPDDMTAARNAIDAFVDRLASL